MTPKASTDKQLRVAFARHRAADPHCSCPDCLAWMAGTHPLKRSKGGSMPRREVEGIIQTGPDAGTVIRFRLDGDGQVFADDGHLSYDGRDVARFARGCGLRLAGIRAQLQS